MRHWPDSLPTPIGPGYELTPADPFLRTDMEVGPARARRLTMARLDRVQAVWTFAPAEFRAFRAWFEDAPWSLAGHSDDLAHWTGQRATWLPGQGLTPAGVISGQLRETAETGTHFLGPSLAGLADGQTVLVTASLRAAGRGQARLAVLGRDSVLRRLDIDLATGAGSNAAGLLAWAVADRGNGWWRVQLRAVAGIGAAVPQARVYTLLAGSDSFVGDPGAGVDIAEVNARVPDGTDPYLPTDTGGTVRGAAGGAAWSMIPLWTGGLYTPVEARFEGMWSVEVLPGLHTRVSAPLEVRNA